MLLRFCCGFFTVTTMLCSAVDHCFGQSGLNPGHEQYSITIPGNSGGWQPTGIFLKKGDQVLFSVKGKIRFGPLAGETDAAGFRDRLWSAYNVLELAAYHHGALLCKNENAVICTYGRATILEKNNYNLDMPESYSTAIKTAGFTGNFFQSTSDQELRMIINDRDFDNNKGELNITVDVIAACPELDGKFDMAALVDRKNGQLDFCLKDNCFNKLEHGSFWADGYDHGGHFYLAINPVAHDNTSLQSAMNLLVNRIYEIFPGGAVDLKLKATPADTKILSNRIYELTNLNGFLVSRHLMQTICNVNSNPQVQAVNVRPYHFTLQTMPGHCFVGTATHGIFKDSCGDLYLFQQGRGTSVEDRVHANLNLLMAKPMWLWMAGNLRDLLK